MGRVNKKMELEVTRRKNRASDLEGIDQKEGSQILTKTRLFKRTWEVNARR